MDNQPDLTGSADSGVEIHLPSAEEVASAQASDQFRRRVRQVALIASLVFVLTLSVLSWQSSNNATTILNRRSVASQQQACFAQVQLEFDAAIADLATVQRGTPEFDAAFARLHQDQTVLLPKAPKLCFSDSPDPTPLDPNDPLPGPEPG